MNTDSFSIFIENQTFDAERALYHLQNAVVASCRFEGEADGESALKEARHISVSDCDFSLRYPLWHAADFSVSHSVLRGTARAPIWYAARGVIADTEITAPKAIRECDDVRLQNITAVSPELGWKCRNMDFDRCRITSEYFLLDGKNVSMRSTDFKGKYSFQYVENGQIENCVLDTKDAFWHGKNITVKDCDIRGEYLGWYSDGLTLIDCHISGTQPLCYCRNLRLVNCTMENTDLSFEYSDVHAEIVGSILSVKNPRSGSILADSYGEILLEDSILDSTCEILTR